MGFTVGDVQFSVILSPTETSMSSWNVASGNEQIPYRIMQQKQQITYLFISTSAAKGASDLNAGKIK